MKEQASGLKSLAKLSQLFERRENYGDLGIRCLVEDGEFKEEEFKYLRRKGSIERNNDP